MPNIASTSLTTASITDTSDIIQSLGTRIICTHEEAMNQNKIQRKQLDYIKEKDAKKKNKYKKWHSTSQYPVINAVLINSDTPSNNIPSTHLCIINSKTAGMADRVLYNQMLELRHPNVSFSHGLAASLFMGDIVWNNWSSPSNLSPFTIFKQDPLSMTQTTQCLHLHLLSKNTKGKSLDERKASQMQEVKVPTNFEE